MIAAEDGPAGCVPAQFAKDWGYSMVTQDKAGNPWFTDLIKLFQVLHIVANNGPDAMGGGGTPRQPLAPPFRDGEPSQAVPSNTAGQ